MILKTLISHILFTGIKTPVLSKVVLKLFLVTISLELFSNYALSQDVIYWRNEAINGDWEYGGGDCNPDWGNWFYEKDGGSNRKRPDCFTANRIHFANGNQLNMNLNSGSDYSANWIEFDPGTGDRIINTDALKSLYFKQNILNAKIENNATGTTHTFNVNINIENGTWLEINPINGFLVFNYPVVNNSGNTIHIWGNQQVTFDGNIMSSTGAPGFTINGNARAVYSGVSKTYLGPTTINNGATLQISSDQTLGDIVLNAGGNLIVDAGKTLTITGTWAGGGTITNNGTIVINGPSAFPGIGSTIPVMNNLSVNSSFTLDKAMAVSGVLTLTNGVVTTTTANLLSIANNATTAISGGSASSFISGPLQWSLPASLALGTTYTFPVGKGGTYLPMSVLDPTTGIVSTTITAEAFTGNIVGGTAGTSINTISDTEYWSLTSTGSFTNHKLSLTRQSAVGLFNRIGRSITLAGAYLSVGGTPSGNSIINSDLTGAGPTQFFVMAANVIHVSNANASSNGDYSTLKGAFDAINAQAQTGNNIVITVNGSTIETASAVLTQNASPWNTLVVYPKNIGYSISGNIAAPLIDLNGADNITIDGRVNQTGIKDLTITKSNTGGGGTIRLLNDATNNKVAFCNILGSSNSGSGVIFFSSGSNSGNDNNIFDNCDIGPATTNYPVYGIYSSGTVGKDNSSNIISNCNIFNFRSTTTNSNGINLDANNTNWIIDANSLFQTTPYSGPGNLVTVGIRLNNGSDYLIRNNYIGGNSPSANGIWSITGTAAAYKFQGISLNSEPGANTIENNTIKGFSWLSSSSAGISSIPGVWCGIYILGTGNTTVGSVNKGNIIGDNSSGSIFITSGTGASGATSYGIATENTGIVTISHNTIGSFTTSGTSENISASIVGIQATKGTNTIYSNTIGTSSSGSLNCSNSSTHATSQHIKGIVFNCGSTSVSTNQIISNNVVSNLNNNYIGSGSSSNKGISLEPSSPSNFTGTVIINNNTINTITTSHNSSGSPSNIIGINMAGPSSSNAAIIGNNIHNLSETGGSAAISATGIYYNGPISGANIISNNFIHTLSAPSTTSTSAEINGIKTISGTTTFSNNIISLSANTIGAQVIGIQDGGGTNSIYHNTVSLTGSSTTSTMDAALKTTTNKTRNIRNNIFANARTGSATHSAINISTTVGLTIDYNDYVGVLTGTTGGLSSINNSPLFTNASGTTLTDYIPSATTLVGTNTLLATITDDIDATPRCLPTMGAQENTTAVGTPGTPTPSATTICQGSANTSYTATATNASSYNWSVTGTGNTISGTGITGIVTWAAGYSGTATVSVTANGCSGPSAAASTTVTVSPTPTATISGTASVCKNAVSPLITFTNPQPLSVTVTYNINGANPTTINIGANTTATVAAPTTTAGLYAYNLVSVVYQTAPTCLNMLTGVAATITVNALPIANASSNPTVCTGETIHLYGGPDGMNSYSWLLPDGTVISSYANTITQDFNSLSPNGSAIWVDNSTISIWYSQRTGSEIKYEADDGNSTGGNQYSYGNGANTDRALGSIGEPIPEAGSFAHGILYQNTSGQTLTSITVTYTLEQWLNSGAGAAQAVTVWYKTSATAITNLTPNTASGWTNLPGLTLNSPINTTVEATALDGNSPANRITATNESIPGISLPNNQYIMIKWEDPDHPGLDHGLGIDDVSITCGTGDVQNLSIPNATTLMSGNYTLSITDTNGCTNTASTAVTINPKPLTSPIYHQ